MKSSRHCQSHPVWLPLSLPRNPKRYHLVASRATRSDAPSRREKDNIAGSARFDSSAKYDSMREREREIWKVREKTREKARERERREEELPRARLSGERKRFTQFIRASFERAHALSLSPPPFLCLSPRTGNLIFVEQTRFLFYQLKRALFFMRTQPMASAATAAAGRSHSARLSRR